MDIGNRKYKGSDGFLRNANTAQRQASYATKMGSISGTDIDPGKGLEELILNILAEHGEKSVVDLTEKHPDVDKDNLDNAIARLVRRRAISAIRGDKDTTYKVTAVGERALKYFRLSQKS